MRGFSIRDGRGPGLRRLGGVVAVVAACGSAGAAGGAKIDHLETPSVTIAGAGSTFDEPFFARAFARYRRLNPSVTVNYQAKRSSYGIQAFQANSVDFGAEGNGSRNRKGDRVAHG